MRKSFIYLIFLFSVFFMGCGRNQFSIHFQLSPEVNGNYSYIYHASSARQSFMVEAVAVVSAGKGEIVCPTKNAAILYFISPLSPQPKLFVWVEKGDKIILSGDSQNPIEWTVKGNKLSEQLSDWRLNNLKILKAEDYKKINFIVASEVKANPDKALSTLLLLLYFDRRKDETQFIKLWNSLKKGSRRDEIAAIISPSDLLDSPATPDKVSRLFLVPYKTERDSVYHRDTLKVTSAPLTVLYFRLNDSNGSPIAEDSLKSLRKRYSESRLQLAEVSLENDSTLWHNVAARDTIKEFKRYWIPGGINNPSIEKLKIYRPDFFIVTNKKGEQIYRGSESSEMVEKVRRTLR